MRDYKKYIIIVMTSLMLFLILYIAFVTFDFFPNKYSVIETNQDQMVMETGIFNKQTFLVTNDNHFELVSAIINHSLLRVDSILTAISILLAPLILVIIGLFNKKERKKPYLFSTAILVPLLIIFLFLYHQEISIIEIYL